MEMDLAQRLPYDVLADVLRCLPPRSLAAARCVCRAWHAIIDDRRLLDRDLLPLSFAGFFINFTDLDFSEFFFRPSTDPAITGDFHFMPTDDIGVEDTCNGLVLLYCYVVNPVTRRWASLLPRPPRPAGFECFHEQNYIVFDPAVSPHYQVLMFMHVPYPSQVDAPMKQQEWPPSRFMTHVFSSETTRWEQRSFVRQGDALGTLADMLLVLPPSYRHHAVYWHGELYVLCRFVMRMSLSNCTYQAIKPPVDVDGSLYPQLLLGRSEKGVYFAALDRECRFRVWILNEFCGQNEWLLKHDNNLHHMPPRQNYDPQTCWPWIMADVNYKFDQPSNPFDNKEAPAQDKLEWYSDNEDVFETRIGRHNNEHITILGFHPYKEVIFLSECLYRGLAYHLDQSKLEDLGSMRPKKLDECYNKEIEQSFPYTHCRFEQFLDNN